MKKIIDSIINQTRKNGNDLLKPEQKELLANFRDFNVTTDWMEGKDITKLEKLLFSHLPNVVKGIGYKGLYSLVYWGEPRMEKWLSGWNFDHATEEEREEMTIVAAATVIVYPIVAQWVEMRENRAMTNGKLPKSARKAQEREEIKGALNPTLRVELEKITEKFSRTMTIWYKDYYTRQRTAAIEFFAKPAMEQPHFSATWDEQKEYGIWKKQYANHMKMMRSETEAISDTMVLVRAETVADEATQSFFFKMADKLGGMVTDTNIKSVEEVMHSESNPYENRMRFEFKNGSGFSILNKVVMNFSPLGTPFNQFPCTFHEAVLADGSKVKAPNENSVKKAFNQLQPAQ